MIFTSAAYAQVKVKGYYRKDGTYVQPHYRSSPNKTVRDNYSYKGNINPYTGKVGTNYYKNNPTSEYYSGSSGTNESEVKDRRFKLPENSYRLGDQWYCNEGFKAVGDKCELIKIPANAHLFGNRWYCNDGYRVVEDRCERIKVPANAYSIGDRWYCNYGYEKSGETCEKSRN
ncbi:MAG: hypothetical protein AB7S78_09135 [Candidatus Omnitrophota bacterium]